MIGAVCEGSDAGGLPECSMKVGTVAEATKLSDSLDAEGGVVEHVLGPIDP